MSEEILAQESEEITEEELEASSEDVSSDDIAEAKAKAAVKKEEGEEDEVEEEEDEKEASEEVKLVVPKTKNGMLKSVYEKLNNEVIIDDLKNFVEINFSNHFKFVVSHKNISLNYDEELYNVAKKIYLKFRN